MAADAVRGVVLLLYRCVAKQDRDAVIAVVEDARAAQEREAERLRDKLSGFGKTLTPLAPRTNGEPASATSTANGGTLREFSLSDGVEGGRNDLVDSAEVCLVVHRILSCLVLFCLVFFGAETTHFFLFVR